MLKKIKDITAAATCSEILERWCPDQRWVEQFETLLPDVDAVSFDVFDTALTRVLDAPVDVFALVEQRLVACHGGRFVGYAAWREIAERDARDKAWRQGRREIRLDDILDALVSSGTVPELYRQDMFEAEVQAEHDCCFAVPEIRAAYDLCIERGVPVLFVSDMYLSGEAIHGLLEDAGYCAPELIVSCETGRVKSDGSQWEIVRQKLVDAKTILHIGDNDISDVQTAAEAGFVTLPFKRACSNHRAGGPLTPAVLPFSRLLRGEMLTSQPEGEQYNPTSTPPEQVMRQLGASWGALVVGSYVKWVAERAKALGLKHIYFCARDGWLPQRAWYAAGLDKTTGISSSYLYISRRSLNFAAAAVTCTKELISEPALNILCGVFRTERLYDLLDRAGLLVVKPLVEDITECFGDLDRPISWNDGVPELKECMKRHACSIYPVLQAQLLTVVSYLCQEGLTDKRVGLVDIGWHGTMQASIRSMLCSAGYNPEIYGLYAGLWPGATMNRPRAGWMESAFCNDYQPVAQSLGVYNNVAILENLFSASEATTIGYIPENGRIEPVAAAFTPSGELREALVEPFQDDVATRIKALFSGSSFYGVDCAAVTLDAALAAIDRLGLSPTETEIRTVGSIHHSIDPGHMTFTPIVRELSEAVYSGDTLDISQSDWIVGSALTALACAEDPEQRAALAQDIEQKLQHYDSRTRGQFR